MRAMRGVVCVCVCLVWSAVASIREWVVLYVRAGVPHKSERLAGGMMEQQVFRCDMRECVQMSLSMRFCRSRVRIAQTWRLRRDVDGMCPRAAANSVTLSSSHTARSKAGVTPLLAREILNRLHGGRS